MLIFANVIDNRFVSHFKSDNMERNELINGIIELVYKKGTHERSWVEDTEWGIKAIDLKKEHFIGIPNFMLCTIALYTDDYNNRPNRIIVGLHGYAMDDEYKEDCISYHTDYDNLSDTTLAMVFCIAANINMETESWNFHKSIKKYA